MKKLNQGKHLIERLKGIDLTADQKPFKEALADRYSHIAPTPLGHYHLLTALKQKFGPNYQSHPDAKAALDHFGKEKDRIMMNARIKTGRLNG